jgi:sialic acid synthase SpsE
MNIKFKGHQATEREVELSQQELFQLFEIMKREFIEHIIYGTFKRIRMPTETEKSIMDYCKQHGVDVEYDKDRIAFFKAILDNLNNPYQ